MKQIKSMVEGTGKVYRFTLYQIFHNKSYVSSLILLAVLLMASVPLSSLIMGGDIQVTSSAMVTSVQVQNDSDVPLELETLSEGNTYFGETGFVETGFPGKAAWKEQAGPGDAYVEIDGSAREGYGIQLYFGSEDVDYSEQQQLGELIQTRFSEARYQAAGVDGESLAILSRGISTEVQTIDAYEKSVKVNWGVQYSLQLVYAILVMMCGVYTVTYIIQTLAEEKASKLVEFMLVSVRPMALVLGKIFACMTYVLAMFAVMAGSFGLSYFVTGQFMDVSVMGDMLASGGLSLSLSDIGLRLILVLFVSLAIGYASFALIAGLFGSACNSIQEAQRATAVPMLIIMAGYMVSLVVTGFETRTASVICSLIPVVSIYCAPVAYLVGNISFGILVISWAIQLILLALLAIFCGKVYGGLILYRGEKLGIRGMMALARRSQ